ncbi:carboxymuconolactone decarboxylase family protein [Massilia dura]|uniref:Carboxymuconolactone decarboxylase family protein n=1 Tax=Pseudoduganella dura TaxID=321982 RepID=A0A6I3XFI2_9BURK|nr:carboxymuconolactone decarboxylase family protein [Pseudoduganella dura]MUI13270.1 carboxymuconolactone decarboxylase family protein [Pseudoduganella dura]GGX90472.1 alkyl hydroperoxide reductase AhpD [Pseudoduganella dura]
MNRLFNQPATEATGHAARLFGAIKSAIGIVPNAYAAIGSNSPVALEAALALDGALKKTSLSARDIEVIKLAVSELAGCDYCLAAHTLAGRKAGLAQEAMLQVRGGEPTGDARIDGLVAFVRRIAGTSGTVPADALDAVRAAGVTDAEIVDTLLAVASITFTNLFNRVHDTAVDFPAAPRL